MPGERPTGIPEKPALTKAPPVPKVSPPPAIPLPMPAEIPPPIPKPAPLPALHYGAVIPAATKRLEASTYCRGLTGAKLADCEQEVADFNELHSGGALNRAKVAARREAGLASVDNPLSTKQGRAAAQTSSGSPDVIKILNNREGKMWAAFLRWCDLQWAIHAKAKYDESLLVQNLINKLDDENSFVNRVEKFVSNPLAVITTAIATYATGGAAAGGALLGLVKGDDNIDNAINKLRDYKRKLDDIVRNYPLSSSFTTIAPVGATEIVTKGDRLLGTTSYTTPGSSPWPARFFTFVDDML